MENFAINSFVFVGFKDKHNVKPQTKNESDVKKILKKDKIKGGGWRKGLSEEKNAK